MKEKTLKCEFCNKMVTQKDREFCNICKDYKNPYQYGFDI